MTTRLTDSSASVYRNTVLLIDYVSQGTPLHGTVFARVENDLVEVHDDES